MTTGRARSSRRIIDRDGIPASPRPHHRDPIFERDGWRCAVPACTARTSLHDHHVLYRSRGGDNRRDNRVAICAAHHLNGIHRFRIRVNGTAPHDLTWEIGCRPCRPPFLRTHGDRYLDGGRTRHDARVNAFSKDGAERPTLAEYQPEAAWTFTRPIHGGTEATP